MTEPEGRAEPGRTSRRQRRARRGRHGRRRTPRQWVRLHPWRSAIGVVLVTLLVAAGTSYGQKLAQPGNETVGEKSVEWLRDNHFGGAVNAIERYWYTHHPPRVGGRPRAITIPVAAAVTVPTPSPAGVAPALSAAPTTTQPPPPSHLPAPAPVATPAATPAPGEGRWVPIGPTVDGAPGLYTTQLRPDAVHTSYLVVAVWMDPKVVRFRLHPGVEVPGGSWRTPSSVLDPVGGGLVAAFNSGFRMKDAHGGFYADGVASPALRPGAATLVIDKHGVPDVVEWGRDRSMGPDIASARQNLALIVDHGKLVPGLDDNTDNKWGKTVGNKVFVWRSGAGITANGALVYVGGPSLSVRTLAETLRRVGAVRAMELDINYSWVSFNSYRVSNGTITGTRLLPEMKRPGSRYLSVDSRDFVAVSIRPPAVTPAKK